MFIRETIKIKKGIKYTQHQLIESVRTPNGPRQKLILNLGFIDLAKDKWKELANSIEDKLHAHQQTQLFTQDPEIEKIAGHYARVIIKERLNTQTEQSKNEQTVSEPIYETIDINTLSNSEIKTIGAEHIVISILKEYGFDKILSELKFKEKEIHLAKMLIAGRLIHPDSERETARWINEDSAISELLNTDIKIYDNALHRTACLLMENHETIENKLSQKSRELFKLKETIILYDLTNTYFEGSKKNSKTAKHGKSKERRNDSPLVTLALTVDEDGFPKKSKILEGNISEPKTLENMLNNLGSEQKTIVIDAGIASEENLEIIKQKQFKYIAVSRKKTYSKDFWNYSIEKDLKLSDDKILKVKLVRQDNEAWLKCYSEAKQAKEKAILDRKTQKFEQELKKIKERLPLKYEKVIEKIGRLKQQYNVGHLYDITVSHEGGNATEFNYSKNPDGFAKEQKAGEYILRTNRLDLTEEEISKLHRSLSTIEDSFRSMKSHLGLRPIYHQRDEASIARIFITVIAYHILAGILKRLHQNKIYYNWKSIRNILSSHARVTTAFKTKDGSMINIRNSSNPTINQQEIYKALNLKQQPLHRVKIKIPLKNPSAE